jgi:hypothetical protein
MKPARKREGANFINLHPAPEWVAILRQVDVDLLAYDGAPACEAAGPLAEAARRVRDDPGVSHPLRPPGASPDGFDAVRILQWAAERCARSPSATVRVRVLDQPVDRRRLPAD